MGFFYKTGSRLRRKKELKEQVDLVEQQWVELCVEYGELKTCFAGLRFRRIKLKEDIAELTLIIEEENK